MSNFDTAIKALLKIEGGLVDNPNDRGGITNYGISLRFLQSINPAAIPDDVRHLTPEKAAVIYRQYFWDHYKIDTVQDDEVAEKLFSMLVNMSPSSAIKIVQTAINNFVGASHLVVDGVLGNKTFTAVNLLKPSVLLVYIFQEQVRHYLSLVKNNASQKGFLQGWINRALNNG